jgi:hypothetical protein
MPSEFDKIKDLDGWQAKLKELLAAAEKASAKDDDDARLAVAARLNQFVLESSPNTDDIVALDQLATNAARELSIDVVGGAVDRIAARTARVRAITKQLDAVTARAVEAAATIRLEKAHRVIDAFTEAVRAVDDFDKVLEDGTDDQLRKRLEKITGSLVDLRDELDDTAGRPQ